MKQYKQITMSVVLLWLAGCASDSQLEALTSRVHSMESQLSSLKNELASVKAQRVVRLPTGAPLKTRERSSASPAFQAVDEDSQFQSAVGTYKSGDVDAAINQFEQFNNTYPNARHHAEVLFYLGQANYTIRDYPRAQLVLEELIYQTPNNQVNPQALDLLRRVYQAQGKTAKLSELDGFLNNINSSHQSAVIPESSPQPVRPFLVN